MVKINFNEGTINFWIPKGEIDYGDNKYVRIFDHEEKDGLIRIQKDRDNGLKIYYLFNRQGKCFLNTKVNHLDKNKKHMITVTWKLSERKVKLYIDGEFANECEIDVTPNQFKENSCQNCLSG
jgi:hypothetical protein